MDTRANYINKRDKDDKPIIDKAYYDNVIRDLINHYIEVLNYNPDKITANHLNAIFNHIRQDIFENKKPCKHNRKCNIEYTENNIQTLLDIYTTICKDFVCMPSLYGFSQLTGIQEDTVKSIVTSSDLEILNSRREYIRNKLSDNNLGITVLANNDTSIGLMYNRQNTIEKTMITQSLSFSDLKPIEQKADKMQ